MCSHLLTTSFKRIGRQDPAEAGRRGKEFVSMRYRKWFLLGMFLVGVFAPAISSVHAQTITSFDVPGSTGTSPTSINPRRRDHRGLHGFGGQHACVFAFEISWKCDSDGHIETHSIIVRTSISDPDD